MGRTSGAAYIHRRSLSTARSTIGIQTRALIGQPAKSCFSHRIGARSSGVHVFEANRETFKSVSGQLVANLTDVELHCPFNPWKLQVRRCSMVFSSAIRAVSVTRDCCSQDIILSWEVLCKISSFSFWSSFVTSRFVFLNLCSLPSLTLLFAARINLIFFNNEAYSRSIRFFGATFFCNRLSPRTTSTIANENP